MIFGQKVSAKVLIIVGLLLSFAIFIIDLKTPLGIADGVCYAVVLLLSMWTNDKGPTIVVAVTGIVLIVAGYFLSPPPPPVMETYIAITNRLLSLTVIIVCAYGIIKYKQIEQVVVKQQEDLQVFAENLKISNFELEERVRDRTKVLKEALDKLEHSEKELRKSLEHEKELNELKSRFVSMASHEFRTPLATILSSLSLISKYGELNQKEQQAKHIGRIKDAVIHLTDLINDVLSVSKIEEGKIPVVYERINVCDMVEGLLKEMEMLTKPKQKLEYNHSGDNEIMLDKKHLKHIMLNLVSNAIKFSNEGSIFITTEVKGAEFVIRVEDNGIGIPEEDQKYLFDRFFRASNTSAIQGTGLGLNIVAKYVEIMDGKIDCKSKVGEGTVFTVDFALDGNFPRKEAYAAVPA